MGGPGHGSTLLTDRYEFGLSSSLPRTETGARRDFNIVAPNNPISKSFLVTNRKSKAAVFAIEELQFRFAAS